MYRINLDEIAPEPIQGHTSKGDQPKWQLEGKWYKADHMGYEALSEVLISKLLKKSNVINFVEYEPVLLQYRGKEIPGCISQGFRMKDEDGHGISIAQVDKFPRDMTLIQMNVDDFEEAYELFKAHGFTNMKRNDDAIYTGSAKTAVMVSPTGFAVNIVYHIK